MGFDSVHTNVPLVFPFLYDLNKFRQRYEWRRCRATYETSDMRFFDDKLSSLREITVEFFEKPVNFVLFRRETFRTIGGDPGAREVDVVIVDEEPSEDSEFARSFIIYLEVIGRSVDTLASVVRARGLRRS